MSRLPIIRAEEAEYGRIVGGNRKFNRKMKSIARGKRRSCGTCTACCTTLSVPMKEIKSLDDIGAIKPRHQRCMYERPGELHGCTIYKIRPESCRDFACAWLQGEIPGAERPDKTGVIIWGSEEQGQCCLAVEESWDGAFDDKRNQTTLRLLMADTQLPLLRHMHGSLRRIYYLDGRVLDVFHDVKQFGHADGRHLTDEEEDDQERDLRHG